MRLDESRLNARLAEILAGRSGRTDEIASAREGRAAPVELSVIFFSALNQDPANKYQLVLDIAAFADRHDFTAVWIPERHFHPFGGIYPDPSVLAAALAVRTSRIRIRSGSVVLPLHHPAEVAESWAMVDNLSGGRVDLSFASGWNPNDFVLSPGTFADLREVWKERIHTVRRLWRGESVTFKNGKGEDADVRVYPQPVQKELEVWLTVTRRDDSFEYAGAQGYNVLTMLQGIELEELGRKIRLYRAARAAAGHSPDGGKVTLMMHTLLLDSVEQVRAAVREPFFQYIKSALTGHAQTLPKEQRPSDKELDRTVEYSYERYFRRGALFGSVADAEVVVGRVAAAGVTEIACLMDFGVEPSLVVESLPHLAELGRLVASRPADRTTG